MVICKSQAMPSCLLDSRSLRRRTKRGEAVEVEGARKCRKRE